MTHIICIIPTITEPIFNHFFKYDFYDATWNESMHPPATLQMQPVKIAKRNRRKEST